jgi:hypothetical protein
VCKIAGHPVRFRDLVAFSQADLINPSRSLSRFPGPPRST